MNPRNLKIFLNLAETLSFRKSSELSHITVSALSRMIQRLEEEVGDVLFERNNKQVILTETGKKFVIFAREFLDGLEEFRNDISLNSKKISGAIKIYSTVTASYCILPEILKGFYKIYPNIRINIDTGVAQNAHLKLESGEVDFAIGIAEEELQKSFLFHKILSTDLIYICPKLQNNFNHNLILPESGILTKTIKKWFRDQKIKPQIHSYVQSHEAILAMVAAGFGSAIIPEIILENNHLSKEVKIFKTAKSLPQIDVGVFIKKQKLYKKPKELFWNFCITDDFRL